MLTLSLLSDAGPSLCTGLRCIFPIRFGGCALHLNIPPLMALRVLRSFFFAALFFLCATPALYAQAQYCITGLGGGTGDASIDSIGISTTTLSNATPGTAPTFYTFYPATGSTTASLMQGATYTIHGKFGGFTPAIASLWIDYNRDTVFQASEWTQITTSAFTASASFTVPLAALTGLTRMRVRSRLSGNNNGATDACSNFGSGETEDYDITIIPAPPCGGTPVVTGVAPAGPIVVCSGTVPVALTVSAGVFSGFTYVWQQSTNGGTTWTATGVTTATGTFASAAANTLYRAIVTCAASGAADTSSNVAVNISDPLYASIPYVQDFESWISYCDSFDVPGNNWKNTPDSGINSWRRYDQGGTAGWQFPFGAYFPAAQSGQWSARWNSAEAIQGDTGALDLYLNLSAPLGPKQLYFHHINTDFFGEDSLSVQLSTDGGLTFSTIAAFDTATDWTRRSVPLNSNSATAIVRFKAEMNGFFDFTDIGIDSVYVALPCTGAPNAGTLVPGPAVAGCPGGTVTFSLQGASLGGGFTYIWQQATSCTAPVWTTIAGATGATYTTPVLNSTRAYRVIMTCTGSGLTDTAGPTCVTITPPTYATLPYAQDFESWSTRCEPTDIPDANWTNTPPTGDESWRRQNQGASANWIGPTFGVYTPPSFTGNNSARFHSSFIGTGVAGSLDLYVNASAPGNKELQLHYINENDPFSQDSLKIFLSTDNGVTFSSLAGYDTTTGGVWELKTVPIFSTSATTVIRFQGVGDFGGSDIGMDNLKVLLPCTGTPNAGTLAQLTPCPGVPFTLQLIGATQAAGLSYQWQQSPNGTTWTPVPGGIQQVVTYSITQPTYFRAIVTCAAGGLTDTTPSVLYNVGNFYVCYCASGVNPQTFSDLEDIGNVTLREVPGGATLFNNGTATLLEFNPAATQLYTSYTALGVDTILKNEQYSLSVTQISQDAFNADQVAAAYIDYNRDGVFDFISEQVYNKFITNATTQRGIDTFTVPASADTGITGLRVVMTDAFTAPQPCGLNFSGETEDYLVYLSPPRCTGVPGAGTAFADDTTLCLGDVVTLVDTGYLDDGLIGLSYSWQTSTSAAGPWSPVAGSTGQNTITVTGISDTTYFRFRVFCATSGLTGTSNVVRVTVKLPIQCYCPSYATGEGADASDAMALGIGPFVVNDGGPHLLNPIAINPYTDRTQTTTAYLEVDSTYDLTVYHALRSGAHQDARVTLFMDFNANFQYDIPQERVFTGFTTSTAPFANGTITIPLTAVPNLKTGMRLIVNEDVAPNVPSDEACGTYFSGETEDYTIVFLPPGGLSVPRSTGPVMSSVQLFPNPATDRTSLRIDAVHALGTVEVTVRTLTGQTILRQAYLGNGSSFSTDLDLRDAAMCVFFVDVTGGG